MRMIDIIQKKRDGLALTKAETTWLIDQYATGQIPDYQCLLGPWRYISKA